MVKDMSGFDRDALQLESVQSLFEISNLIEKYLLLLFNCAASGLYPYRQILFHYI